MDIKFIAKFICAVYERIYLWLQQCSICSAVTDTDLCLVDFTPLIQGIQYNHFNYMLPPRVLKVEKSPVIDKAPKKKADVERNNSVLNIGSYVTLKNGKQFSGIKQMKAQIYQ